MYMNANCILMCIYHMVVRTILVFFNSLHTVVSVVCIWTHDTVLSMGPYLTLWMTFTGFVNPEVPCRNLCLWKYVLEQGFEPSHCQGGLCPLPDKVKNRCVRRYRVKSVLLCRPLSTCFTHTAVRDNSLKREHEKDRTMPSPFPLQKIYICGQDQHKVESGNEDTVHSGFISREGKPEVWLWQNVGTKRALNHALGQSVHSSTSTGTTKLLEIGPGGGCAL